MSNPATAFAPQTSQAREVSLRISTTPSGNIDLEARTITDVILAQVGEARGHGFEIQQSFLEDMLKYIQKELGGKVKSNYGHNWNNLGKQLGSFTNLRITGDQVRGDLKVYESADLSPNGQLGKHFLALANEDETAVACSIRFVPKYYYQLREDGSEVVVDFDWWEYRFNKAFENKPVYAKFGELRSCDVVDEGALTDTLFNADQSLAQTFMSIIEHPEFMEVLKTHHKQFTPLEKFYAELHKRNAPGIFSSFKNLFNKQESMAQENPTTAPTVDPSVVEQLSKLQGDIQSLSETIDELKESNKEKDETIAQLNSKIKDLESEPEVQASAGQEGEGIPAGSTEPVWMQSGMNKRVAERLARKGE